MKLIGHRGARREAPENTLGGFRHIVDLGLKAVEFDVQLLTDGRLAVLHDASLTRTAGVDVVVETLTSDQLVGFDNRQGWPTWPTPEPVPTLQQALALMTHFEHIEVEVKAVADQAAIEAISDALVRELAEWANHDAVTVTSFDVRILAAMQARREQGLHQIKTGLLIEPQSQLDPDAPSTTPLTADDLAQPNAPALTRALALGCSRMGLFDQLTTLDAVRHIHAAGLDVSVWTVNDPDRARALQDWGIEGLISDVPSLMLQQMVGEI